MSWTKKVVNIFGGGFSFLPVQICEHHPMENLHSAGIRNVSLWKHFHNFSGSPRNSIICISGALIHWQRLRLRYRIKSGWCQSQVGCSHLLYPSSPSTTLTPLTVTPGFSIGRCFSLSSNEVISFLKIRFDF